MKLLSKRGKQVVMEDAWKKAQKSASLFQWLDYDSRERYVLAQFMLRIRGVVPPITPSPND